MSPQDGPAGVPGSAVLTGLPTLVNAAMDGVGAVTPAPAVTLTPAETPLPRPISDALRAQVDRVMATPIEGRGAATVTVSLTGVEGEILQRLSPVWSVGAWGAMTWDGQKALGARLRAAW